MRIRAWVLLAGLPLSLTRTGAAACVPTGVSSATLEIAGDDRYYAYLNGVTLTTCTSSGGGCYKNYAVLPVSPALIALPPAENVLAVYATDIGGQVSGVSWRLTINYTGCPSQTVLSDGACTKVKYAGNVFQTSGTPPVSFPANWTAQSGFNDASWVGPWSNFPCAVACSSCCANWDLSLSLPWMWGGQSYLTAYQSDGFLFRQTFMAGDPAYCGYSPLATPTLIGTITPGTVTPVPPATNTFTRSPTFSFTRTPSPTPADTATATPTATPSASPTLSASPSASPTRTPTATPSATPTQSPTATLTPTPSATWTRSATATLSPSPSVTLTPTGTWTPSVTATLSPSPSVTPTPTGTWTRSLSPTPSFSATETLTRTGTATPSLSPTRSFSATQTLTRTGTATPSLSPTQSDSPTETLTRTGTATPTLSATVTATGSETLTSTGTATPSVSRTVSFTATQTLSATGSSTPSVSNTVSDTPTQTLTPSGTATPSATRTATPTDTVTLTATASATPSATPSQTLTATDTPPFTPTATPSASPSATATPTVTPSASPSGTPSASPSPSATGTLTPTLTASPSATASGTRTATPSITRTATATPSATASATHSPSPSITLTGTPSPPLRARLEAYNSAGERVALLADGLGLYQQPDGLRALNASVVPGSGVDAAYSLGPGQPVLTWNGQGSQGQALASGAYYIVLSVQDSYGATRTYNAGATVLAAPDPMQLKVFNSAGELVRQLSFPTGQSGTRLQVTKPSLVPLDDPLQIQVGPGPGGNLQWDGLNALGQPVSPGVYQLVLLRPSDPGSGTESLSVTVLAAPTPVPRLLLGPQPLRHNDPLHLAAPGAAGWLHVDCYNLAGERIGGSDGPASGFTWQPPQSASGLYVFRATLQSGTQNLPLPPVKAVFVR